MRCFKCGLQKSGPYNPRFECSDCIEFSPILINAWNTIDSEFSSADSIDPDENGLFRMLADTTFVTATNPQTRIFYSTCETLVASALQGETEIADNELAQRVRTTRGFSGIFRTLVELNLVKIRNEKYRRVLVYQDKLLKMARQYLVGTKVSDQLTKRLAHVYAGYVLLYVISLVAKLRSDDELDQIPYGKRPQSLWVVLMYLWRKAHKNQQKFTFEDMRSFFARRGLTISVTDTISRRLQALDGKTTQGMIKEFRIDEDEISFIFEDYILAEFERIRELERTR